MTTLTTITTITKTKIAMVRSPGFPIGMPAPLCLNCECGSNPLTDVETKSNVKCSCGKFYTYNGWII